MSNNTNVKYACEQFDGKTNFGIWQSMVKDILVQQGLLKPLLGNKPESMDQDDWEELQAKVVSMIRKCPERKDKKNGKKHMNNANVVEEDDKSNDGDLYLVSSVEKQEGSSYDNSELWHKRLGHLSEGELHEQRTKSADESTDGSTDEQPLEDPEEHPSDS
ncbi:hypothetical protein RJ640_005134 [Escallonia rubra]|uniref:GAG-pre-integrase domain-containing protein n=1 Tax=Escallonia rubra TaxID=112253 RepID=A0AA88U0Z7_9ASTE|nr:hypothetical protein RJ640_008238 [Escallonia rubra]KAK2993440.1 hypothetical protein RJ640_005134 [Escallonia rubra]